MSFCRPGNVANQYTANKLLKGEPFWELTESQPHHAALIQRTVSLMLLIGKYLNLNNGSFQHTNLQTTKFVSDALNLFVSLVYILVTVWKILHLGNIIILMLYTLILQRERPAKYCRIPLLTLRLPELYIWRFDW